MVSFDFYWRLLICLLVIEKVSTKSLGHGRIPRQTSGEIQWLPQIGTVSYPKIPILSPECKPGDVFLMEDNNLYMAEVKGNVFEMLISDNSSWRLIEKGTFRNPKTALVDEPEVLADIFYEPNTLKYYITSCEPECRLIDLNFKSIWMQLLYEDIKDTQISDLSIPGTHDSASWGINKKSSAVDGRVRWLHYWWPQTMVNWTKTQNENLLMQLEAGYRELDLRIADMGEDDGGFVWWHILSADPIEPGLKQIKHFVENHPYEIIIIDFQHLKRPKRLKPITNDRFDVLSDIILRYLKPYMLTQHELSFNPTVGEILDSGKNIIAFVEDPYMQSLSQSYWPKKLLHSEWKGKSNPEDLFNHRSQVLLDFKKNYPTYITDISGAVTLDHDSISIGQDDTRSFEGTFYDLITMARYGANTRGMKARDSYMYSSGNSVHYRGFNDMYRYWLARPSLYKPNIAYVDDAVKSSTIVSSAIEANMKQIKREVAITYQGSPRTGFYEWFEGEITGAREAASCDEITGQFIIRSEAYQILDTFAFTDKPEEVIVEGQYPPDTIILVQVRSINSNQFYDLYSGKIQDLINNVTDLYVRGGVSESTNGKQHFAYISKKYNLYGETCNVAPVTGYENIVTW